MTVPIDKNGFKHYLFYIDCNTSSHNLNSNHSRWHGSRRMWSLKWEETGEPQENPRALAGEHHTLSSH